MVSVFNVSKKSKLFFIITSFISLFTNLSTAHTSEIKTVTVIQIIEHPALDATRQGIFDELQRQGFVEGKNLNWFYQSAQGNAATAAQISQKFVSEKPAVIVAIATTAAQAALAAVRGHDIPIVFSSVTDPLTAKLVVELKNPEGNITGVSNFIAFEPRLRLFREILPDFKRLGVIYNPGDDNSVTLVKEMERVGAAQGLEIVLATALKTSDVMAAAQSLCGKVDAIFINNDNTALAAFDVVVRVGKSCKIPVFASDSDLIENGAVAVLGPNQYKLGEQTGRMIANILREKPKQMPEVEFPESTELFVNVKAAAEIGITIPEAVLKRADKVIR